MPEGAVSPEDLNPRSRVRVEVDGTAVEMAYVDVGEGDPIVFLHGNPTSSYLWRNVIPHVRGLGRCIAPDLVGMGESGKLPDPGRGSYAFQVHARYLDALLEEVELHAPAVLVLHDWGSALGFDWAERHRDQVRGIAFMEALVNPMTWADWPQEGRHVFEGMRSDAGEGMVLDKNVFVERILPASVSRGLDPRAHEHYRRPFERREDRWPTLEWPRQLPIANVPADVHDVVDRYGQWLRHSDVPKLFLDADPGFLLKGRMREIVRRWPALTEVRVSGHHFVPEDSPDEIGRALAEWIPTLR
jgi:haloalkane dehalogenase